MYTIKFYKGNYKNRQEQANEDNVDLYVEHHFNSSSNKKANYAITIVANNASEKSKNIGRYYSKLTSKVFSDIGVSIGGKNGIVVGGYNGRGNNNLRFTKMPAILVEPLFGSTLDHARKIKAEDGQDKLAKILAQTIINFFPEGGNIGFSIGHKYKVKSNDKGAILYGGEGYEGDYAEIILTKTKEILENFKKKEEE